ncbi:hypothetical protein BSKO_02069 [Bryopsis sp. KO-2023]|nr:hypothetical protein BSKO_02069 [Bryopsis sp. KO-2023]
MDNSQLATKDMLKFFQSTLAELDAAEGCVDEEAHAKLQQLEQAMSGHSRVQQRTNPPAEPLDDIQIAQHLDRLEEQLVDVERKIAVADDATKQLLGAGTQIWMGLSEAPPPAPSTPTGPGPHKE